MLTAALAFAGGCGPTATNTTMVVTVWSDLAVPQELDSVEVVVANGELRYPFALGTGAGRQTLPIEVALTPGGSTARQFEVDADGLRSGTQIISQAAMVSFVPGTAQQVVLFLARSCLNTPACPADSTCQDGSCVSKSMAGVRGPFERDGGIDVPGSDAIDRMASDDHAQDESRQADASDTLIDGTTAGISVQCAARDLNATDGSVAPHFMIYNLGTAPVPLSEVTLRYWYTIDTSVPQTASVDFAMVGAGNITESFGVVSPPRTGADTYCEVGFTQAAGSILASSNSGEIDVRFNKNDFSNYIEANDYSYPASLTFAECPKTTLYRGGVLIWGAEP